MQRRSSLHAQYSFSLNTIHQKRCAFFSVAVFLLLLMLFLFLFCFFSLSLHLFLNVMMMFFRSFFKKIHRKIFKWLSYWEKHTNFVENLSREKKRNDDEMLCPQSKTDSETFLIFSQNVSLFSQCSLIIKFVCRLLKHFHPLAEIMVRNYVE